MNFVDAMTHLQERLSRLNMGQRLEWSLDDRSAVSLVCITAAQPSVQLTSCTCGTKIGLHVRGCALWRDSGVTASN